MQQLESKSLLFEEGIFLDPGRTWHWWPHPLPLSRADRRRMLWLIDLVCCCDPLASSQRREISLKETAVVISFLKVAGEGVSKRACPSLTVSKGSSSSFPESQSIPSISLEDCWADAYLLLVCRCILSVTQVAHQDSSKFEI